MPDPFEKGFIFRAPNRKKAPLFGRALLHAMGLKAAVPEERSLQSGTTVATEKIATATAPTTLNGLGVRRKIH